MSNYLAIATVTGTLHNQLLSAASVVPGANVTTTRPDGAAGAGRGPGINIFLYQVMPNPAYRNADLPTRRGDGQLAQRPQAALTLHYILSFFGDDANLEPQRLLGAAIRQLHARPLLTKQDIVQTIANTPYDTILPASNLADQVDLVRFTPMSMSLEELSKAWSVFFQSPYVLSVAYQASAVLIETDDAAQKALPVQSRNLYVVPFRQPFIERVISSAGEEAAIFSNSTLRIDGKQLQGEVTLVLLGGAERAPLAVNQQQISLTVPPDLQAGARGLQVMQKLLMGSPAPGIPHRGFESNVATFVLRPRITLPIVKTTLPDPQGGAPLPALQLNVDVPVGKDQRVALLLNSVPGPSPTAYSFLALPRAADSNSITIAAPGVAAGQYLIRIQIDGAESPLDLDPTSVNFGPAVTLP
jgi:Pvc16 N-terminal domain